MEALGPLAVAYSDLSQPGSYNSHFQKLAAATAGDVAAKMKRLQRELRNLNTKTQLPVHAAAAIFVCHDSERIDKMRVIITGECCFLSPCNTCRSKALGCHLPLQLYKLLETLVFETMCIVMCCAGARTFITARSEVGIEQVLLLPIDTCCTRWVASLLLLQARKARHTRVAASSSTCSSRLSTLQCRRSCISTRQVRDAPG